MMNDQMDVEKQVRLLGEIQPWNHNFHLPGGIQTRPGEQTSHGKNLVKLARLEPLFAEIGLEGKRVLDVGCNEGFFSMHMAGKGAHVLGIDIDQHRIAKSNYIRSLVGEGRDVQFQVVDIYSEAFRALPQFDLCLCLGFIHRVPDPFSALAALARKSNLVIFEWKALKFGPHDDAFAYFSPKDVDAADYFGTEYWLLSYAAVERIMRRAGFRFFHRVDDPRQRRALMVAGCVDNPLFRRPDRIIHRGRIPALLSHTRRYLRTVTGIISGRVNA